MKINISSSLKNKISQSLQGGYILKFDKYDDIELYNECKRWYNFVRYEGILEAKEYKLNIGNHQGVYPIQIGFDRFGFSIDYYKSPSWKDWFIIDKET